MAPTGCPSWRVSNRNSSVFSPRFVQFSREYQGILFDVFLVPADTPFAALASKQGKRYALASQTLGHGLGPPHAYVFGALVSWISQLDSATSVDTQNWKQYQTLSMDEKSELKKMCRVAKLFDPKMKKLVMCFGAGPEARALRSRLLLVLKSSWVEEMVSAQRRSPELSCWGIVALLLEILTEQRLASL